MSICRRYIVSGKVQGVWFRASTKEQAIKLNITGYANNLPDGNVEVLACGSEQSVDSLQEWLWQGPPMAYVDKVDTEVVDCMSPEQFITR